MLHRPERVLRWARIKLPPHLLGDVIAATYSYRDGRLWVLDEDPTHARHPRRRLVRIEPETGAFEIVAASENHDEDDRRDRTHGVCGRKHDSDDGDPAYDFRGLSTDMDGRVVMFASSEREQSHRLAVLAETPGGFDARISKRRHHALSMAPIADLRGFALYFDASRAPDHVHHGGVDHDDHRDSADKSAVAERLSELPVRAATLDEVEELLQ
jgi:hypothetical protein